MSIHNTPEYSAFLNTYFMLRKGQASINSYGSQSMIYRGSEERTLNDCIKSIETLVNDREKFIFPNGYKTQYLISKCAKKIEKLSCDAQKIASKGAMGFLKTVFYYLQTYLSYFFKTPAKKALNALQSATNMNGDISFISAHLKKVNTSNQEKNLEELILLLKEPASLYSASDSFEKFLKEFHELFPDKKSSTRLINCLCMEGYRLKKLETLNEEEKIWLKFLENHITPRLDIITNSPFFLDYLEEKIVKWQEALPMNKEWAPGMCWKDPLSLRV